jgi:hypothetical protein
MGAEKVGNQLAETGRKARLSVAQIIPPLNGHGPVPHS